MKKRVPVIAILVIAFTPVSCDFRKSINKDLKTGMVTRGNGLSCDNVSLVVSQEKVSRSTFTYGERLDIEFVNIEGFTRKDNLAFPGMQITVTNTNGDTVLHSNDVYAEQNSGFEYIPLTLTAYVPFVDPIHSGGDYSLYVNTWDKSEPKRTFSLEMDLQIVSDEKIQIESNQISFDEVYLFSAERNLVLLDHIARRDEYINLNLEGLEGLVVEDGKVLVGLRMLVKDASGTVLIDEPDLTGDGPIANSDIASRFSPNFVVSGNVSNPITCEVSLWDKNSNGSLNISTRLRVE